MKPIIVYIWLLSLTYKLHYIQIAYELYRQLKHYHQVFQMPNIWHLAHQTPKDTSQQVFQMAKYLAHVNSTVTNMERYKHKCQTQKIIFYSSFLSPLNFIFRLFLSLLINLSPNPCSLSLLSGVLSLFLLQIRFPALSLKSTVRQRCGSSLLSSLPPSPIKPPPSPLVWKLHRHHHRLRLNPSQPRLEVVVTACLMRILATTQSQS